MDAVDAPGYPVQSDHFKGIPGASAVPRFRPFGLTKATVSLVKKTVSLVKTRKSFYKKP